MTIILLATVTRGLNISHLFCLNVSPFPSRHHIYVTFSVLCMTNESLTSFSAIKKRMEKDIDEVGKIAHGVKAKIEAINREVT